MVEVEERNYFLLYTCGRGRKGRRSRKKNVAPLLSLFEWGNTMSVFKLGERSGGGGGKGRRNIG